jgi:hypothetical protein
MEKLVFPALFILIIIVIWPSSIKTKTQKPTDDGRKAAKDLVNSHNDFINMTLPFLDMVYADKGFVKAVVVEENGEMPVFLLELEQGKRIIPLNLEPELMKNGKKVWVKLETGGSSNAVKTIEIHPVPADLHIPST